MPVLCTIMDEKKGFGDKILIITKTEANYYYCTIIMRPAARHAFHRAAPPINERQITVVLVTSRLVAPPSHGYCCVFMYVCVDSF